MLKWLRRKMVAKEFRDADILVKRQAHYLKRAVVWAIFSDIGLEDLQRIVDKGKKNKTEKGETDYTSLAELCVQIMQERKAERMNLDEPDA